MSDQPNPSDSSLPDYMAQFFQKTYDETIKEAIQCQITITNSTSACSLVKPRFYLSHGKSEQPLPSILKPGGTKAATFSKTPYAAHGVIGVLTYDVQKQFGVMATQQIAIMFSVPFSHRVYSNLYAVGLFGIDTPCDQNLLDNMYHGAPSSFVRGNAAKGNYLSFKGHDVSITASMSEDYDSTVEVEISDS